MKHKKYYYPIIPQKYYEKKCVKCKTKFVTQSRNKKICNTCKKDIDTHNNNKRVRKHYKKYGKKNKIGTGRLEEHPLPPLREIDAIIEEMRNLNLL